MMRFTDEVQIDRAYHKARAIIERLRKEILRLREENTQLKNRPDPEPLQKPSLIVRVAKDKLDDPIAKWTSSHFVRYFQEKFKVKYGEHFSVRGDNWKAYTIRIKSFRDQNVNFGIGVDNNPEYLKFIDWLFESKFNSSSFIAVIGGITSSKLLQNYRIATGKASKPTNYDDLLGQIPRSRQTDKEKLLKDAF